MSKPNHVLAIDQGTTSTRAIVFDHRGLPVAAAQQELPQLYPDDGWVEHDAEGIWRDTQAVSRAALAMARLTAAEIAAIGITNQRETTVLWDRQTGVPLANAIVWQDRRTAEACRRLRDSGVEPWVQERTGLLLDPYFSATKLAWQLEHVPGARARAERGELCFGTIDSFLLYRLTGGAVHATDATNASRTLLFNIVTQQWDAELLRLFGIPEAVLPQVQDCSGLFGTAQASFLGAPVPITGIAGDQQAATIGQACFTPGMIKSTYGTGCFALLNIGDRPVISRNRLLTTTAYRLNGKPTYAVEGAIFVAGAAVKWLRDQLRLIPDAAATATLAAEAPDDHGCYLVPAFTGLGAPYWDPDARAALVGLTLDCGVPAIARATLESMGYQTRDLIEAMLADGAARPQALRIDGGMAANDWMLQFLADILAIPVERPVVTETTALGAAILAGLAVGVYPSLEAVSAGWHCERRFEPAMDEARRAKLYQGWQRAVARVR
ncbi:MAG: glycerol kinase GlpK [Azospirillum sp.]|nr:glycerol kinase GlpK [Azospirillum sp.]